MSSLIMLITVIAAWAYVIHLKVDVGLSDQVIVDKGHNLLTGTLLPLLAYMALTVVIFMVVPRLCAWHRERKSNPTD
jgi:hypothetical protein